MANDVTKRPWKLDTPSPGSLVWPPGGILAGSSANDTVFIEHAEWANYAAQGHQCVLKDRNGAIVWSATGAGDLSEVRSGKIGPVAGLILDTLTSGQVLIFIK
jgi:hypothetical protein